MAEDKQSMCGDLAESIAMLEQILEVMPQDSMALQALYNAYSQCGEREQAFKYLSLLSDVAYDTRDTEVSKFLIQQLPLFGEEFFEESAAHLDQIRPIVSGVEPSDSSSTSSAGSALRATEVDIGEELALAWKLYEENQLSQEEYSSVLHDLTEVSSKELEVPISVLHVLNDRGFNQMNRIMNYLSTRSGVPCISLLNFELPEQVAEVLPLDISVHDGALPFGFFGNDLLVAVLNPFNNMLVDKVERTGGHRCHTYLVSAEEYDVVLEKLRAMATA